MKIIRDQRLEAFEGAGASDWFKGKRIKDEREEEIVFGGRTRISLFETTSDEGRPHPRLRTDTPPATDPVADSPILDQGVDTPPHAAALKAWLRATMEGKADFLACADLDLSLAPAGSERFWRNSISDQRNARLIAEGTAIVDGAAWSAEEKEKGHYALRELDAEAFAGDIRFDDANTGTYHSFQHDAPFVHYLERILASLPEEGTKPFVMLGSEQQEAVRRQRAQTTAHLDFLMRHKYANHGIEETDIEKSLGGRLIDKARCLRVSEKPASADDVEPQFELLRINPTARHQHKGEWIYRDGPVLRLQDGTVVQVDEGMLRGVDVAATDLTFERAPDAIDLRDGVRFDWDENGWCGTQASGLGASNAVRSEICASGTSAAGKLTL